MGDKELRLRQKMIDTALPLLPPGSEIRQVVGATNVPFWLLFPFMLLAILPGALLFAAIQRVRLVAVTDDAVYVLACSAWFGQWRAKRVLAVLPRNTRLGPPAGLQTKAKLGTMTLYLATPVGRSGVFRNEVMAADAGSQSPQPTSGAQSSQALGAPQVPAAPSVPGAVPGWSATGGQGAPSGYAGYGPPDAAAPVFAGFWIRLVAYVIDAVIMGLLSATIIGIVVAIPYMPVMWWKKGATLGQKAMGLKVVRAADGGPVDGMSAFIRFIVFIVEALAASILIGLLGFIWAAFDKRKRAWHDMVAGTVVIFAT
jgi:uncharacterized RDD family membrane protein YckC